MDFQNIFFWTVEFIFLVYINRSFDSSRNDILRP